MTHDNHDTFDLQHFSGDQFHCQPTVICLLGRVLVEKACIYDIVKLHVSFRRDKCNICKQYTDFGLVDCTSPWKRAGVGVLFTNTAQISIERTVPSTVQKVRLHRK